MITTAQAIKSLDATAEFTIYEDVITWITTPISDSNITAEKERLKTEYDAQEYARKRKAKYDALNQFELISDDAINGTTTHKDAILAIKAEFPKP